MHTLHTRSGSMSEYSMEMESELDKDFDLGVPRPRSRRVPSLRETTPRFLFVVSIPQFCSLRLCSLLF